MIILLILSTYSEYSSNGSIDLIFPTTPVSYNSLTVDSVMTTQSQLLQSPHANDKKFAHFCTDDIPRYVDWIMNAIIHLID